MTINWLGLSSFKIKEGETTLIIDPLDRKTYGLKPVSYNADIYLLSSSSFLDYDKKVLDISPNILKYPGEYEIRNINFRISQSVGPEGNPNNVFCLSWQGIVIVHLGILRKKSSIDKILETINGTDVLMIPVGNKKVLGTNEALEITHQIEPSIVIPMFYKTEGKSDPFGLEDAHYFVQEIGQEKEELEKLKISNQSINQEKTKLVILRTK